MTMMQRNRNPPRQREKKSLLYLIDKALSTRVNFHTDCVDQVGCHTRIFVDGQSTQKS